MNYCDVSNCCCSSNCNINCSPSSVAFVCPPSYSTVWMIKMNGKRVSDAFKLLHYGQPMTITSDFAFIFDKNKSPIICHLGFCRSGEVYLNDRPYGMKWKQQGNNILIYGKNKEYLMTGCQSDF